MARTSVICGTPELVRQLTDQLKACPDVAKIGRMKNGFGSTAVGRGGYRDIKVNLMPARVEHYVEVQVIFFSLAGLGFLGVIREYISIVDETR